MPQQTALHAPLSVGAIPTPNSQAGTLQPPTSPMANMNLQNNGYGQQNGGYGQNRATDEKKDNSYYQPQPTPVASQPPPAYAPPPGPPPQANYPPLAQATALYPYNSNDAGDLALQPNDHITVTEYMNAEWWKGRSSRTGQEGIFPRSYVRVIEDKGTTSGTTNNYGNAPLEVSGEFSNTTLSGLPRSALIDSQVWATAKARLPASSKRTARSSARSLVMLPSSVLVLPWVAISSTASSRFALIKFAIARRLRHSVGYLVHMWPSRLTTQWKFSGSFFCGC